jgi:hypothetical protein
MRRLLLVVLLMLVAGCGSSAAPVPTPTATATESPAYTDVKSGVTVGIVKHVLHPTYALLYVVMRNDKARSYQADTPVPFQGSGLVEPNLPATASPCDSDSSIGKGLQYSSVPGHSSRTGWIRCDYSRTAHVLVVFWLRHQVGGYRIR